MLTKSNEPGGCAEIQRVCMDLEKGGGKIEDYDYAKTYSDYDFEHNSKNMVTFDSDHVFGC